MKFNLQQQILTVQLVNFIITLYGVYYTVYIDSSWILISYFIAFVYTCVGLQACYHRLLAHKSYKTYKWIEYIMSMIGMMMVIGSPITWVSVHRQHHRYPDTDKDPHSPYMIGLTRSMLGIWKNVNIEPGCGAYDLAKSRFQRFIHHNYMTIVLLYALTLYTINPLYGIFFFSFPSTLLFTGANVVNTLTHYRGYRNYETSDKSFNNWIAWGISLGTEGWHNNHHKHPREWNYRVKWWELDITSVFVRLIKINK